MFKDVEKIVENLVYALFFATPIIWSENMVSEKIQNLLIFNPIYHFIVLFRDPLMNNDDGNFYESFSICLLLALIVFIINLKLFKYLVPLPALKIERACKYPSCKLMTT